MLYIGWVGGWVDEKETYLTPLLLSVSNRSRVWLYLLECAKSRTAQSNPPAYISTTPSSLNSVRRERVRESSPVYLQARRASV